YRHGYVQKIYASMRQLAPGSASAPQGDAIPVVSKPSRRTVGISRYPVYASPAGNATPTAAPAARPSRMTPAMQAVAGGATQSPPLPPPRIPTSQPAVLLQASPLAQQV